MEEKTFDKNCLAYFVGYLLFIFCCGESFVFVDDIMEGGSINLFSDFKGTVYLGVILLVILLPRIVIPLLVKNNFTLQFTLVILCIAAIVVVLTYFIPKANPEIFTRLFEQASNLLITLGFKPILAKLFTTVAQIATLIATIEGCIAFYQRIFINKKRK